MPQAMNDNGGGSTRSIHRQLQNNSGEETDLDLPENTQVPLRRGKHFYNPQFNVLSLSDFSGLAGIVKPYESPLADVELTN